MKNVLVITGGGSGMGLEAAKLTPKEKIVVISGRTESKLQNAVKELKELGLEAYAFACDTSKRESVKALAEYAKSLGEIKNVINAAGVSPAMHVTPEEILRINALGTVYVNQEFSKLMNPGSVIVDVSSNSAYQLPSFFIPKKKYKMSIEEYNKFKQKQREHQLRELPALYILICILLRIDPLPEKIEIGNYRVPITKEMKISLKHLESLSKQTILLSENKINNLEELKSYRFNLEEKVRNLKGKRENLWRKRKRETNPEIKGKITHEIANLKALINKTNKDIVGCYEIENRTILLKNQLKIEKSKEIVKDKKKDKSRGR